jgi:tRNA (Thr-GGU) A37 N-methylase
VADEAFEVSPVGYVRRDGDKTYLEILESYVPALKQMEHFSHVHVLWWFSEFQDDEHRATIQIQPPTTARPSRGCLGRARPRGPIPSG